MLQCANLSQIKTGGTGGTPGRSQCGEEVSKPHKKAETLSFKMHLIAIKVD